MAQAYAARFPSFALAPEIAPTATGSSAAIFFHPDSNSQSSALSEIEAKLRTSAETRALSLYRATSILEIKELLPSTGACLLFFHTQSKDDLKNVLEMMEALQSWISEARLRILGINDINHEKVPELLLKNGCSGFLPPHPDSKTLRQTVRKMMDFASPYTAERAGPLRVWLGSADPERPSLVEATPMEFAEQELVLDVPAHQFGVGDRLFMILDDGKDASSSKTKTLGVVKQILVTEADRDLISVEVEGDLGSHLAPLRKAYSELQAEITDFLKSARGW